MRASRTWTTLLVALSPVLAPPAAGQGTDLPTADPVQGPEGTTPGNDPAEDDAEAIERVEGPYRQGMARVLERARAGDTAGALATARGLLEESAADRLAGDLSAWFGRPGRRAFELLRGPLDWAGLRSLSGEQRAAVQLAIGALSIAEGELEPAREALERAAVEAGPGTVRGDALHDLGWIELVTGEAWRERIPEVSGQPAAPPAPPAGLPGGSSADPEAPDPLEMARASYLAAREHLVQCLRQGGASADTRANAELCLRRLRELEDIERRREEQQQEQQEDQDQQQQEDSDNRSEDSGEDQDSEEQQEQQPEQQEPEPSPEDSPPEGEQEDESQEQPFQREVPEEKLMTREEMKRLLDRLRQIDEKGEELRERLRGLQRTPVERDW